MHDPEGRAFCMLAGVAARAEPSGKNRGPELILR